MTDDKQDPSVVAWRSEMRLDVYEADPSEPDGKRWKWTTILALVPPIEGKGVVFRDIQPLSLTSDLTAMKAELEEAKKEIARLTELHRHTHDIATENLSRAVAVEQERDDLREALNLAAINRATEPSNGGTA